MFTDTVRKIERLVIKFYQTKNAKH